MRVCLGMDLSYINIRYGSRKSNKLQADSRRKIGFLEVQKKWTHPNYVDNRCDDPAQYRAIGWVQGKFYSVIFEIRGDEKGEHYHLVTLWKSTKHEERLYEERR